MTPQEELAELKQQVATASIENISLKERVDILEKKTNGTLRSIIAFGAMLAVYMTGSYFFMHSTFSGRWISTHDREGHIGAWLDDTGLELKDVNGNERAKLGLFPEGSPFLQFFDEQHNMRAQLFLYKDGGGTDGYLMLWDKNGKGVRYPPPEKPLP